MKIRVLILVYCMNEPDYTHVPHMYYIHCTSTFLSLYVIHCDETLYTVLVHCRLYEYFIHNTNAINRRKAGCESGVRRRTHNFLPEKRS